MPPDGLAKAFGRISGAHFPRHHARPRRLDFAADPELRVMAQIPPKEGPAFGSLVSAVNDDGNEIAGITLPELRCPWPPTRAGPCGIPTSAAPSNCWSSRAARLRTRREREAAGDPRPSLEERYASREAYLASVRRAALDLVAERHLLEEDVEVSVTFAARAWDWLVSRA